MRAVTKKGKLTLTFTDHYPVVVDLEMPKTAQGMELQNYLDWNTSKPWGWQAYKQNGEISAVELCTIENSK